MRVYLAGPDVFHPEALALGEKKKQICRDLGLDPVFPLDEVVPPEGRTPARHGLAIAEKDFRLARSCAAALVNLTPFHGPSMDVGTAVELGFMAALGHRLVGYSTDPRPFGARVAASYGTTEGERRPTTPDGYSIEPFGLTDNLMVDGAIHDGGGRVFLPESPLPFEDLTVFRQAAEALAASA
ncbi:nucleoside 2-deoxyribosyltransferase [Oceanicola sp. S124]|uniref:nucleoside 2-deoxyribosyltransferase n=1 Tax=Oceanicola sp. S124 TaxID=1042378 RepID=UPI00025578FD|nr:nucleoside 2-deoxyribosyltransferase [Oceanicola sp. S124]